MRKEGRLAGARDPTTPDSVEPNVSRIAVEAQLDRILASRIFAHSENLGRFLQFVVASKLDGRANQLKEYSIGVEVFGRGAGFDPKEDTIVRVQARNLRSKLCAYYESAARRDEIRIDLPKGTYVPVFHAAAETSLTPSLAPVTTVAPPRRLRSVHLLIGCVVLAGAVAAYWFTQRSPVEVKQPLILIAPFSGDSNQQYFANGFVSDLASILSRAGNLQTARLNKAAATGGRDLIKRISNAQPDAVLAGSISRVKGSLHVAVQLLRPEDGVALLRKDYSRSESGIFDLQEEIARSVLHQMHAGPQTASLRATHRTKSPQVYDLYLRGRSRGNSDAARSAYEEAISKDPNFAPPYAALAGIYSDPYANKLGKVSTPRSRAFAAHALELDGTLAEAHLANAQLLAYVDLDWAQADREYRRAVELDPGLPFGHYRYATFLTKLSRLDDALAQVVLEERLTPFSPAPFSLHGWILSKMRQFDQAFSLLNKALRLSPDDADVHMMMGEVCLEKGDYVQALQEFDIALPRLDHWQRDYTMGMQGFTHAVVGQRREAQRLLKELREKSGTEWVSPIFIALICIGLGDKNATFDWLNQAFEKDRVFLSVIKIDPLFDSIRADPRYHDLLRKLKLE